MLACRISVNALRPEDYDKRMRMINRHEDNEKIYFLIKTKADEYCFTNIAFIHVDGQKAISSKCLLKRYPYLTLNYRCVFGNAGKVDLDVEIKFDLRQSIFQH